MEWQEGDKGDGRMSFQWRAGDDRTTTGIWLWSEPFFRKIGKEEVAVLLMDTQVRGADYNIIVK